ncbi:CaiB/BaiF CoA-transferase family protein [Pseudonocardia sp. NPDC046786]|uniref:CaiB/BaiF CoA transferase family protein n=1 Tax=Pseudonocardia sp. NPDC046786 TaxID=3155471 RepID=UPI0033F62049
MPDHGAPPEFASGPLTGIKVLDLTTASPGLYASMLLADMGAEVIKISAPAKARSDANSGPATEYRAVSPGHLDRNKRSIRLNLKNPKGKEVFLRLAECADVVIEGFRPGVTKRLGIEFETLRAKNPGLIYAAMSGYGQDGPSALRPGHDLNYLAEAGVLSLLGPQGGTPSVPLNLVADLGGAAMHTVAGILLALFARERGHHGQFVDVSYIDTSLALLSATPTARAHFDGSPSVGRGGDAMSGAFAYYGLYTTADGELLSVGCLEPWFWTRFCEAVERPDLDEFTFTPDHYSRGPNDNEVWVRGEVEKILAGRTAAEWLDQLEKYDLPVSPVRTLDEVARDPQTRHRGIFAGTTGETPVERRLGLPIVLSETPGTIRSGPPVADADAEAILRNLGYSEDEVASLRGEIGAD